MSSRGGRQDTAREAHVEDVARVFSSAYAGKNTVGFCTFDRDANAFSLAQAIVRDDDEDVLEVFDREVNGRRDTGADENRLRAVLAVLP